MTPRVVRSQSIAGARISGSSFEFSANSEAAAASSRKSISIRTDRARVLDDLDDSETTHLRGNPLRQPRSEKHVRKIAGEPTLHPGAQHFDRHGSCALVRPHRGSVDLRDRGGGDRFAERFKQRFDAGSKGALDDADRGRAPHRRHPILQALKFERDFRADDVRSRREKLAELDVGRAEPVDGAGEAGQAAHVTFGDEVGECDRQARHRRHKGGIDVNKRSFSREDKSGAREPEAMAERGDEGHYLELPARVNGDDPAA